MHQDKQPDLLEIWKITVENHTLLSNHLKHHETWFKCVVAPLAVVVVTNFLLLCFLAMKNLLGG